MNRKIRIFVHKATILVGSALIYFIGWIVGSINTYQDGVEYGRKSSKFICEEDANYVKRLLKFIEYKRCNER